MRSANLLVVVAVLTLVVSCDRFLPPTLDGEAFLVMKSLDVKKLPELKVYLLRDPNPMISGVKKGIITQYDAARKAVLQSNPEAQNLENRITDLKAQAARLEQEKQSNLQRLDAGLDNILLQLGTDLKGLKSNESDLETQIVAVGQKLELARRGLESLKSSRLGIEAHYTPLIQGAEADSATAQQAVQDYTARTLAATAKVINDYIASRKLEVDFIPEDGRFGEPRRFSSIKYEGEIFENKEDMFLNGDELAIELAPNQEYGKHYLIFANFPASITNPSFRRSFYAAFIDYAKQRGSLEAARDAVEQKHKGLQEELRVALQKFDEQNGARMGALSAEIQKANSDLKSLQARRTALRDDIASKQAVVNEPREQQAASLRAEIESSFAQRQKAVEQERARAEEALSPLVTEALSSEWRRILGGAQDEAATGIARAIAASATTDRDGRFVIRAPSGGDFVVYAETTTGEGEHILWFENLKVAGRGKTEVKLSNSNAQRAQGLGALLFSDLTQPK